MEMMIALILLAVVLFLCFLVVVCRRRPLGEFPSPPGELPLLGHALQIDNARPHHTMHGWAEKLGPIFVFRILGKAHVVLNSPEALYEALVIQGEAFAGRPYMYRADYSFARCQNVAFQTATPHWRMLRKEVHTSVKQFGAGLQRLEGIAFEALDVMSQNFSARSGQEFDARQDIYETFTNIMCTLILGRKLPPGDPMLAQAITMEKLYCDGFQGAGDGLLLDILPLVRYLGNKSYKTLTKAMECRDKLWGAYLPELKQTVEKGKERGIADSLFVAQEELKDAEGNSLINDDSIMMALTDVINGGTVTTSSTLYGFLNIILHYPNVQDKLHEEILRVQQQSQQHTLTLVNKAEMPYARALLLELLRYTTIGSLGLPHETMKDTELAGYKIPKGTFVMPNLWAAHHDPRHWDDPWSFIPERFLDEDGDLLLPDHPRRKWFMPFGAGPRVCLGEQLALNRLFLAIIVLCQRFQFLPGETLTSCDPRTYEFGGLLKPLPFTLRVKKWDS